MKKKGFITLITGPMYSGKSKKLLEKIKNYENEKKKILILNYKKDNRYTEKNLIYTHDNNFKECLKIEDLSELKKEFYFNHDVVFIDEGHFFKNIHLLANDLANNNIHVYISCLISDYNAKPFKNIIDLIPLCDNIIKLKAICDYCKDDADFSKIINKNMSNGNQLIIGEKDKFRATCRKCFFNLE